MSKGRLEAFSDGVIAILITIMVLELKVPHGIGWEALRPVVSIFLIYVLSFVFLGIYWTNHHHMLHAADRINGKVLWANLHLLFWLSLIPFVTGWMGENQLAPLPTAVYGGGVAHGRGCIHDSSGNYRRGARSELEARGGSGQRREGQGLAAIVRCGDPAGVCQSMDRHRALCLRGAHVARSGPADRVEGGPMSL